MNNALGLLGLAKRAGKLAVGEELCGMAVRDKKARTVFTASDASERAKSWADSLEVPHIALSETRAELGHLLGRASCAQLALLDIGMAASVAEQLSAENESARAVLELLREQAARAKKRKAKKLSRKG